MPVFDFITGLRVDSSFLGRVAMFDKRGVDLCKTLADEIFLVTQWVVP